MGKKNVPPNVFVHTTTHARNDHTPAHTTHTRTTRGAKGRGKERENNDIIMTTLLRPKKMKRKKSNVELTDQTDDKKQTKKRNFELEVKRGRERFCMFDRFLGFFPFVLGFFSLPLLCFFVSCTLIQLCLVEGMLGVIKHCHRSSS